MPPRTLLFASPEMGSKYLNDPNWKTLENRWRERGWEQQELVYTAVESVINTSTLENQLLLSTLLETSISYGSAFPLTGV